MTSSFGNPIQRRAVALATELNWPEIAIRGTCPGTLGQGAEWILLLSVFRNKEHALTTEMPPREPFETTFRPSHGSKVIWLVLGLVVLAVGGVAVWRWKQSTQLPTVAPVEESKP